MNIKEKRQIRKLIRFGNRINFEDYSHETGKGYGGKKVIKSKATPELLDWCSDVKISLSVYSNHPSIKNSFNHFFWGDYGRFLLDNCQEESFNTTKNSILLILKTCLRTNPTNETNALTLLFNNKYFWMAIGGIISIAFALGLLIGEIRYNEIEDSPTVEMRGTNYPTQQSILNDSINE
jgi:hypothetical protein